MGQFEAEDASVAQLRGQHATSTDHKCSVVKQRFDLIEIDAWQRDQDEYLVVGLQYVDRRLPAWLARPNQAVVDSRTADANVQRGRASR